MPTLPRVCSFLDIVDWAIAKAFEVHEKEGLPVRSAYCTVICGYAIFTRIFSARIGRLQERQVLSFAEHSTLILGSCDRAVRLIYSKQNVWQSEIKLYIMSQRKHFGHRFRFRQLRKFCINESGLSLCSWCVWRAYKTGKRTNWQPTVLANLK